MRVEVFDVDGAAVLCEGSSSDSWSWHEAKDSELV
jgi:hypothetical protein